MPSVDEDPRIGLVEQLTDAFGFELARRDPSAPVAWARWPDIATLAAHVSHVHRWATAILRTGGPVASRSVPRAPDSNRLGWYEQGRDDLLEALRTVPAATPCWIIGDRAGVAAFWRRRMVFENVKHLTDIRASGGGTWRIAPELAPEEYADGIDELFEEFLPRSRPSLQPLPAPLVLVAGDAPRRWSIDTDWSVGSADLPGAARVFASAGDLALTVWERADPLDDGDRFRLEGNRDAVAALRDAPIHPG